MISDHILAKFTSQIQSAAAYECWNWTGSILNSGYGQFFFEHYPLLAHRVAYVLWNGEIGDKQIVHHICDNKKCVNPDHLALVTYSEHRRLHPEMNHFGPDFSITHCPRGHPYSGDNVRYYKYTRICRACDNARSKKRNAERKRNDSTRRS